MSVWLQDELRKIAAAEELRIWTFREDGKTYRAPVPIWSVVVQDALFVRAYRGTMTLWYQAAKRHEAGRIAAAGITREVCFEPIDGPLNDSIDDAYRAKYAHSPYLSSLNGPGSRGATLKVTPREVAP